MTVARTICLGFLGVIIVGALFLMLPISSSNGSWTDPVIALFMSTSAVCVTGLSVIPNLGNDLSFWGQLFLVLLVQIGGLGYMTSTTFLLLLLGRKFGLRDKIAIQQSLDMPGMAGGLQLVQSIMATTALFELTGTFLLMLVFVPELGFDRGLWFSIFHSVSAFNNAGFGLFPDNLIRYVGSPIVNFVITGLIIFGGIGYRVIMEMYLWLRDRLKRNQVCVRFSLNFKIATTTTLLLLGLGTITFFLLEFNNPGTLGPLNLGEKILAAWFQSVTPRTAGFNTIDIGKMTTASLFLTIVLMFMGASPGGTGGGIKTTTVRVLYSSTLATIQGEEEVVCFKRQIPLELIIKALGVTVGSLVVVIGGTILMSLSDPKLAFMPIFYEVVSAFGTVGLSTGITPIVSTAGKLILIATMYIGRVGVLLLMSGILGEPKQSSVRYPEENLLVG